MVTSSVIRLGELSLKLGEVNRITFHTDGVTPESDTTHTVMLGLIATAFAHKHLPQLDLGLVAQYALVHDLVEVYAGDTPTLRLLTPEQKADKDKRETEALHRLSHEFADDLPWVTFALHDYETGKSPEARYVRTMDKILPKITHLLNDCAGLHENGITADELRGRFEVQVEDLRNRTGDDDFGPVFELYTELVGHVTELFAAGQLYRHPLPGVIEVPAEHFAFGAPWNSPDPVRAELGRKLLRVPTRYRAAGEPFIQWRLTSEQFELLTDHRVPVTVENVASIKIFGRPIMLVHFDEHSTLADVP